jgi:hypothetical protein
VGSSSVVTKIHYARGSVVYSTFDAESTDVLRLDFSPESITADGQPLSVRKALDQAGFTFDETTHVLRLRHDNAKDISIQGKDGSAPPLYVTFDDPHLAAGTRLEGEYPSGVIDWVKSEWKVAVPRGKFGTFNLVLDDPAQPHAEFRFYAPRIFVGADLYNDGKSEATITIHSPEIREFTVTLRPGELKRVRTGWRDPSTSVVFDLKNAEALHIDNVAYLPEAR